MMKHFIWAALFTINAWALDGDSIYNLDSKWSDQNNSNVQLSGFRGHPVFVVMLYTSCKGACPILIADALKIQADLNKKQKTAVRFLAVSLDPARDSVAALKKFAGAHHLDSAWSLLHGTEGQVRELANVLGVKFKRTPGGDYSHSNIISLLDTNGIIRHQQLGLGKSDKEIMEILNTLDFK